ncbi:MAG: hypothetical protein ACOYU4_03370 [Thermodesulfobacteriota bacterium]
MRRHFGFYLSFMIVLFLLLACSGPSVKYYASDACLVKKGETTKKDIMALFGRPSSVENRPDGSECWYYNNEKKDLMGKIPYLGEKLSKKEIETIKIEFAGEVVSNCYYTVKEDVR